MSHCSSEVYRESHPNIWVATSIEVMYIARALCRFVLPLGELKPDVCLQLMANFFILLLKKVAVMATPISHSGIVIEEAKSIVHLKMKEPSKTTSSKGYTQAGIE